MPVERIPSGYATVTPYLIVQNASSAIDFYKRGFGATEVLRLASPDGTIAHAEIKIGDSHVMIAEEIAAMHFKSPGAFGGTPVSFLMYVDDVDSQYAKAVAEGAMATRPIQNQFYGDRSGTLTDPFGHVWTLATHIEDVSPEEMKKRFESMTALGT